MCSLTFALTPTWQFCCFPGYKSEVQIISDEETKQEVELRINGKRSEPKQQQQPSSGFAMSSMESIQSAMDFPMDWTNISPSAIIYDIPPPQSHLPTSVTSSLYIQPKSQVSTQATSSTGPVTKLSTALDARLELGVTMEAEWDLKTLQVGVEMFVHHFKDICRSSNRCMCHY